MKSAREIAEELRLQILACFGAALPSTFIPDVEAAIIAARTEMREAAIEAVLDEACEICYSTEEIEAAIRSLNPEGEPQEAVEAK